MLSILAAAGALPLHARDVFVMLSGGASPMSNNYSQYLQAKAVTAFFRDNYPEDSVWTFFGAGNVEGDQPVFGDVRRQLKRDGLVIETWLPGPISHNRPARREVFLKALHDEILPAVHDGGTLYLFVGDHGSLSRGDSPQSTIDLWGLERDPGSEHGWKFVATEKLTVSDLRQALIDGLGKGRVVFCMTQCYSGGFHFLGVPRDVVPDPGWFTSAVPDWAFPAGEQPLPLAAGYTATDYYSLAAGCDPDPDPDRWAGYERFAPEQLLGLDLFSLERSGKPRRSFHDAHVEATLVDRTIDKPHSTSERYLERWATLIETRLATVNDLAPAVARAMAGYQRAVETGSVRGRDPAFRERQAVFRRFTKEMGRQNPAVRRTLLKGTRAELEKLIGPLPPAASFAPSTPSPGGNRRQGGGGSEEARTLWRETIRPAWKKAVIGGEIPALANPQARKFELDLLAGEETRGRDFMFTFGRQSPILTEIFWASGAADPATADAAGAEAVARWGAIRRREISQWARASADAAVSEAAEKVFRMPRRRNSSGEVTAATGKDGAAEPKAAGTAGASLRPLTAKTAAERALFYRRVLAAWAFLLEVKETSALENVRQLTELERTPLPGPSS